VVVDASVGRNELEADVVPPGSDDGVAGSFISDVLGGVV
jgi:hypothetical protein